MGGLVDQVEIKEVKGGAVDPAKQLFRGGHTDLVDQLWEEVKPT